MMETISYSLTVCERDDEMTSVYQSTIDRPGWSFLSLHIVEQLIQHTARRVHHRIDGIFLPAIFRNFVYRNQFR